ncbi:MAG TPA: 2-phospho-L-lactate transferase [Aggregatilineaceae bacterium]|nr:2-phospho-L-lactate transferase [Anaerolineae bacterium]HMM27004.1 2-phospho-L-lactate transferase [Aggregatilineaceae bacterium]
MVLDAKQADRQVIVLAGGVGGAKLAYGVSGLVAPERLAIVGNVADDFELYGLHISPDLDTLMYTLAGVANPATGWGVEGDTRQMLDMLACFGETPWFGLGDRDLATHLLRTSWLAGGATLTAVTARLVAALGVGCRLLPATDDLLRTMIDTREMGTLGFQEYFVRHRWQPVVERVWFRRGESCRVTEQVRAALDSADLILIAPSNPVLSIGPILAVDGMRDLLTKRRGPCIVISPFVAGRAVKGPADKLMRELSLENSPRGVAQFYAGLIDGLVIDRKDADAPQPGDIPVLVTDTLMMTGADKVRLAGEALAFGGNLTK